MKYSILNGENIKEMVFSRRNRKIEHMNSEQLLQHAQDLLDSSKTKIIAYMREEKHDNTLAEGF